MKQEARRLFDYYYPIEINLNIPETERIRHMKEWTQKAIQLLINYTDKEQFERTLEYSINTIKIRD